MKRVLSILILLASANLAVAQKSETEILDQFFELYRTNSVEAINYLYSTNSWVSGDGDAVQNLKSQLKQFEELVGDYQGEEFIYKGGIGESFSTYIYLVKYDRQPIRFTFEFYRPKEKWILYSFKFDDNFDEDFEEAIKSEYLKSKS